MLVSIAAMMLAAGRAQAQQQVGHKALGTLGLQASLSLFWDAIAARRLRVTTGRGSRTARPR